MPKIIAFDETARRARQFAVRLDVRDHILKETLIGEDHIVCSSDIPHSEKRENSATKIIERTDLSETQKRKILYDNSVRLFGVP